MKKQKLSNLVNGRYLVNTAGLWYSMDIVQLSPKAFVLIVIDLGSRCTLLHIVKNNRFTSADIINEISRSTLAVRASKKETYLHCDCDSIFTSEEFQSSMKTLNIKLSYATSSAFGNQVSEKINRTLRQLLNTGTKEKETLVKTIRSRVIEKISGKNNPVSSKSSTARLCKGLTFDELKEAVDKAMEIYNNRPHRAEHMFNMSPFNMDEALANGNISKSVQLYRNDNSTESIRAREIRATVVEKFANNWLDFFLEWEKRTKLEHQEVMSELKHSAETQRLLYEQNRRLEEDNAELRRNVKYLVDRSKTLEQKEKAAQERKERRQKASKLPSRDSISFEEFQVIKNLVPEVFLGPLLRARVTIALVLLYYTGLRVSNLLLINWNHYFELLEKGGATLPLVKVKAGPRMQFFSIGTEGQKALAEVQPFIDYLREKTLYDPTGPVFSAEKTKANRNGDRICSLSRVKFTEAINKLLARASLVLRKNIRSHSFRITLITDLLKNEVPIQRVKDIIGHQRIDTTLRYERNSLTRKEVMSVASSLNKARSRKMKARERKNKAVSWL